MPAAIASAVVSFFGLTGPAAFVVNAAVQVAVIAGANAALAQNTEQKAQGSLIDLTLDSAAPRRLIIGKRMTGGVLVDWYLAGTNNTKLYLPIYLGEGPCGRITRVFAGGREVFSTPLAHGVRTNIPEFRSGGDRLWLTYHDGRAGQTADATLVNLGQGWTSANKLTGCAWVLVECQWDSDNLRTPPQLTFEMEGAKLYDRRKDTTAGGSGSHRRDDPATWEWSDNPMVALDHFMLGRYWSGRRTFGIGLTDDEIPYDRFAAQANVCDEDVDLRDGGTQKRYRANGFIFANEDYATAITRLCTAMAARPADFGGRFGVIGVESRTPVLTIDDADVIAATPEIYTPKRSWDQLVGAVEGRFQDPAQLYKPVDFPRVTDAAWEAEDGGEPKVLTLDLEFETDVERAQRLALLRARAERRQAVLKGVYPLWTIELERGDWFVRTGVKWGEGGKTFEVIERILNPDNFTVSIVAQEVDPADSAWDESIAQDGPPAPIDGTDTLAAVSAPSISTTAVQIAGASSSTPALKITFANPSDPRVTNIFIEVFRVSDGLKVATVLGDIPDDDGQIIVQNGIAENVAYTARAKFLTSTLQSDWSASSGATTANTYTVKRATTADTATPGSALDEDFSAALEAAALATSKAAEAAVSALTATNKASAAATSAGSALTHQNNAETAASNAETAKGLAQSARDQANAARDAASGSKDAAALSASAASTSKDEASESASAASLSSVSARTSALVTIPSDWASGDQRFWCTWPTDTASANVPNYSVASTNTTITSAIYSRGYLTVSEGRKVKLTARVRRVSNNTNGVPNNWLMGVASSAGLPSVWGDLLSAWTDQGTLVVADGWKVVSVEQTIPAGATRAYASAYPSYRSSPSPNNGDGPIEIDYLKIEDVSESKAAAASAAAAYTSEQTAGVYKDAAGLSAGAANTAKLDAQTAKGLAESARDTAVVARDTASEHAATASTKAGEAASSANIASGKADAASESASVASTKAGEASQSASAANSSLVSARSVAASLLPSTFDADGLYFSNDVTAWTPTDIYSGSFVTVSGVGRVFQTATSAGTTGLVSKGYLTLKANRRHRVTARVRVTVNGTPSVRWVIGFACFASDQSFLGHIWTEFSGDKTTSDGWYDVGATASLTTETIRASYSTAAYIRPLLFLGWADNAPSYAAFGSTSQCSLLLYEDITESYLAAGSASAAASSAASASTYKDEAFVSARSASGDATIANTKAGLASTYAGQASVSEANALVSENNAAHSALVAGTHAENASGWADTASLKASIATDAASAASASAALSASIGIASINSSPTFADNANATGAPTGWTGWANSAAGSRVTGLAPQPYSYRQPGGANANAGLLQTLTDRMTQGWYVLEADVTLVSGTLDGAGVYVQWGPSGGANASAQIYFPTDTSNGTGSAAGSGTVGQLYRFRKLINVNSACDGVFQIYLMSHWVEGFGNCSSANSIDWRRLAIRAASQAEIEARQAKLDLATANATITSQGATIATNTSAIATLNSTVTSNYDATKAALAAGNANLCPDSEFYSATTVWSNLYTQSGSPGTATVTTSGGKRYYGRAPTGMTIGNQFNNGVGLGYYLPVITGERLEGSVTATFSNCTAQLFIDWFDASNTYIGSSVLNNSLASGTRAGGFATVPSGAAYAALDVVGYATASNPDLKFTQPFLRKASAIQTALSPYVPTQDPALNARMASTEATVSSHTTTLADNSASIATNTSNISANYTTLKGQLGAGSVNRLTNTDFAGANTEGWVPGWDGTVGGTITRGFATGSWTGTVRTRYVTRAGTPTSGTVAADLVTANNSPENIKRYAVQVSGGQRIWAGAYLGVHRCKGAVTPIFYDAAGAYVSEGYVETTGSAGNFANGDPANAERVGAFFTAPSNARYVALAVYLVANGGTEPYVFWGWPMIAMASSEQTTPPPYVSGGLDRNTGTRLTSNEATVSSHTVTLADHTSSLASQAQKLAALYGKHDSVIPDAEFQDGSFWSSGSGLPSGVTFVDLDGGWTQRRGINFAAGTYDLSSSMFPVEPGATYRIRCRVWSNSGSFSGWFHPMIHMPWWQWFSLKHGTSVDPSVHNSANAIVANGDTGDLEWIVTNATGISSNANRQWQFRLYGSFTGGPVTIAVSIIRLDQYAAVTEAQSAITSEGEARASAVSSLKALVTVNENRFPCPQPLVSTLPAGWAGDGIGVGEYSPLGRYFYWKARPSGGSSATHFYYFDVDPPGYCVLATGQNYTLSAVGYAGSNTSGDRVQMYMQFIDGSDNVVHTTPAVTLDNYWDRKSTSSNYTGSALYTRRRVVFRRDWPSSGSYQDVVFNYIKLEAGTTPTAYTFDGAAATLQSTAIINSGAISNLEGGTAWIEAVVEASGGDLGAARLRAGKDGSFIELIGTVLRFANVTNGSVIEVMRAIGGEAYFSRPVSSDGGGRRLTVGPGYGVSGSQVVLWFGPDSVAPASQSRTNGYFSLGTDSKVYLGSTQLVSGGGGFGVSLSDPAPTASGSGSTQTTGTITATVTGGSGSYSYSWALELATGATPTISAPSSASTTFTQTGLSRFDSNLCEFALTVRDLGTGATAYATCQVTFQRT